MTCSSEEEERRNAVLSIQYESEAWEDDSFYGLSKNYIFQEFLVSLVKTAL